MAERVIRNAFVIVAVLGVAVIGGARSAAAQSGMFEASGHVSLARSSEFDTNDVGIGGRAAWNVTRMAGVEAEVTVYPGNFPDDRAAFSRSRVEGLFGVTVGPRISNRFRPFAKVRPGFLRFSGRPVACILIFPPPLSCVLAAGRTVFVMDLGGGVDADVTQRLFIRVDAGDRLVRYPGPSFVRGRAEQEGFYGNDFRFSAGLGVRF